jgi:hypothetical protein
VLSRTATVKGEYQRPVHVLIRKYKVFEQIRRSQAAEVGNYGFREWVLMLNSVAVIFGHKTGAFDWNTAEIYLLGAHVTGFQKNGEQPLVVRTARICESNEMGMGGKLRRVRRKLDT